MNKEQTEEIIEEKVVDKEKIALIEITPYEISMSIAWHLENAFEICDKYVEPISVYEDIDRDGVIKPTQVVICKEIIKRYRKICDLMKITKSIAYATCDLRSAKNHYGFLDELEISSSFKIKLLDENDEMVAIHTAVVNSMDMSKAIIFSIEEEQTRIIGYNRRLILGRQSIPFGFKSLKKLFMESDKSFEEISRTIKEFFIKQIQPIDWLTEADINEVQYIGIGDVFLSLGKISRKGKKYPLDLEHAYQMSKHDLENVLGAVNQLKLDKDARIKGISSIDVGNIVSGFAVVSALFEAFEPSNISIATTNIDTGLLFKNCVTITNEKPLADILAYSLETNQKIYQPDQTNGGHIFDLAMLLFKQLRVMHRLSRNYIKPLKIAAYMCNSGARMRFCPTKKDALQVITHSQIFGASHKEIVLGAFIAGSQYSEEFSLSEWVKYKDMVNDEDLQAVRFLAVLLRICSCFECTGNQNVNDIICDVLGDSVILKTVSENDLSFERQLASQASSDFKKVFGKTLELL